MTYSQHTLPPIVEHTELMRAFTRGLHEAGAERAGISFDAKSDHVVVSYHGHVQRVTTWTIEEDPYLAGSLAGQALVTQHQAHTLKRSMEAALYPVGPPEAKTEQATLQRLEDALDRLESVVARLTRRVDALTDV